MKVPKIKPLKEIKIIKTNLKEFFKRKGKIFPPYVWSTIFLTLAALSVIVKLAHATLVLLNRDVPAEIPLSGGTVLGMLGFCVSWIAIYNWQDIKKNGKGN